MRDFLIFLAVGWAFLVFRSTLFRFFPEELLRVEPVTVIVIYLGFTRTLLRGSLISFLLGYMTDLFSGGFAGLYTLVLTTIFFLTRMIRNRFYTKELLFRMGTVFLLSFLGGIVMFLVLMIDQPVFELYPKFFSYLVSVALFNAIFSPLILMLFKKIDIAEKKFAGESN